MLNCRLISDIHIEFGFPYTLITNQVCDDVLILAGDIGVGAKMTLGVLEYFSTKFPHVVYVFGNHEFYGFDIDQTKEEVKNKVPPNVHVLDRHSVVIDGVTFVGATLWSSFNNNDPAIMSYCSRNISDFLHIRKEGKRFLPMDAAKEFDKDWGYIKAVVKQNNTPVVVVTHFLPSWACIDPIYRGEGILNHYFANELGNEISYMDNVPLWFYGHTHSENDTMIGSTRVMCNPYGYHNRELTITTSDHPKLNLTIQVD